MSMEKKRYFAGLDLGGTFVKGGIADENGVLLIKDKIPTGKERPYAEIATDMAALVKTLACKAGVEIEGVGIGSPGTVDSHNGVIVYSNNIAWKNVPLGAELQKRLNKPVFLTNDANAAALGESFVGAGKTYRSILFLTLGTGVGGGIILDGKLFEGNKSAGAEVGHTVIRLNGERCTCGRRGCLEAYTSATALIRQTKREMEKDTEKSSLLWTLCDGCLDKIDGRSAFDAAARGDKIARRLLNRYLTYLAEGIANFANIFRPEAILIGGGISGSGEQLRLPLQRKVNKRLYGGSRYAPVKVEIATLGNDAGLLGAVKLAKDKSDL